MLYFVWHLRGSVALTGGHSNEVVLDCVEHFLKKQQKSVTERGPEYLAFDDPLWSNSFAGNWLAMVIYDRGRFWIERGLNGPELCYDLRSLHGLIFCLLAALIAFFFGLADNGSSGGLRYAAGAFAWLYGMNVLFALIRVPTAIRKAVSRA